MELILVRHGLPDRREDTADPPLSAIGREQAERVARWLMQERIDAVVSSPMVRAVQTAEPLLALAGLPLVTHPDIYEFDRDTGTYIPIEELKRDDYPAWRAFMEGGFDVDIAAFQRQVVDALEGVVADNAGKTVAVFCHGGVINVWANHVLRTEPRLFFEPGYASVHRFLCARSGERNVVALNERAHLTHDWTPRPSA